MVSPRLRGLTPHQPSEVTNMLSTVCCTAWCPVVHQSLVCSLSMSRKAGHQIHVNRSEPHFLLCLMPCNAVQLYVSFLDCTTRKETLHALAIRAYYCSPHCWKLCCAVKLSPQNCLSSKTVLRCKMLCCATQLCAQDHLKLSRQLCTVRCFVVQSSVALRTFQSIKSVTSGDIA